MDGIHEELRNDRRTMQDIMRNTRKTPDQKLKTLEVFGKKLFSQKTFKEWGMEVDSKNMTISGKVLCLP